MIPTPSIRISGRPPAGEPERIPERKKWMSMDSIETIGKTGGGKVGKAIRGIARATVGHPIAAPISIRWRRSAT